MENIYLLHDTNEIPGEFSRESVVSSYVKIENDDVKRSPLP